MFPFQLTDAPQKVDRMLPTTDGMHPTTDWNGLDDRFAGLDDRCDGRPMGWTTDGVDD